MKYFSRFLNRLPILFLTGMLPFRAACEEWKELPDVSSSVTSVAEVGPEIWFDSHWGEDHVLTRLVGGRLATIGGLFQAAHSAVEWYPEKLFSDGRALFVDHLIPLPADASADSDFRHEILRYDGDFLRPDGGFSRASMRGQLIYMDDTVAYTFSDAKFLRYRGTQSEILVDSLPIGNQAGSSQGSSDYVNFFFPDRAGGFWFGVTSYSDIVSHQGLYHFDPTASNRISQPDLGIPGASCCSDGAIDAIGRIFIGTSDGLFGYQGKGVFRNVTEGLNGFNQKIGKVFVDRYNTTWVTTGVSDTVLQIAAFRDGRLEIRRTIKLGSGLRGGITDIQDDADGNIWFTGENIPIQIYNPAFVTTHLVPQARSAPQHAQAGFNFGRMEFGKGAYDLIGKRRTGFRPGY